MAETNLKFYSFEPLDTEEMELFVQCNGRTPGDCFVMPFQYTNWWDEHLSWHENCYIHAGLNPGLVRRVKGPDAKKFLMSFCTNTLENFPVGKGKHTCFCHEDGKLIGNGVIMHVAEDDYICHGIFPVEEKLKEAEANGVKWDVEYIDMKGEVFVDQLAGPRSLEVVEAATGEDLHDIGFMQFKEATINGKPVWVFRMGMSGTLAYEVHGKVEDALEVYNALYEAGKEFGITKLGRLGYINVHTESGFTQMWYHFPVFPIEHLTGSMGDDVTKRYRNPIEVGFKNVIRFDHDYPGREALEKEVANPTRVMVTLVWNVEDILDVCRSLFEDEEPYQLMEWSGDLDVTKGYHADHADQVLVDGKLVGISSGRFFSPKFRKMISICSIDTQYSEIGTEVKVLWGDPGRRQKEIRATVEVFPIIQNERNEHVDVNQIPRPSQK